MDGRPLFLIALEVVSPNFLLWKEIALETINIKFVCVIYDRHRTITTYIIGPVADTLFK